MTHRKHTKLHRRAGGQWGRNEIAIVGAPCGEIKKLVSEITEALAKKHEIAYIDAEHHAPDNHDWSALNHGAKAQLTDKISHYSLVFHSNKPHFFNEADLVLVNGNHFTAHSQIAWVHPKKSLENKLEKLTNTGLVILDNESLEIPGYLARHLQDKEFITVYRNNTQAIINFVTDNLEQSRPNLNGLVLIGGKSTRMKKDKSRLIYDKNQPQDEKLADLLAPFCSQVYFSVRDEEQAAKYGDQAITDKFIGLGPFGGILSAFQFNPDAAWLVVAVDLPFLNKETIGNLVDGRKPSKMATCFIDPQNEFPEPLISIWEPRAYLRMLEFLAKGYSCPRKVLINSDVEVLTKRNALALTNVNTPEEHADVLAKLKN
jgi:molybdopterin-guanine dinucleotide biosynthesis protein A